MPFANPGQQQFVKAEAPANYSAQPQQQPAQYNQSYSARYNQNQYGGTRYDNRGYGYQPQGGYNPNYRSSYQQPQQPPRNSYEEQRQQFCVDVANELRRSARPMIDDVLYRRHADPNYLGQVLQALENDEYNGALYDRIDRSFKGSWPTPQQLSTLITNYVDEVLNRDGYARGGNYRHSDSWSSQYGYGEDFVRRDQRYARDGYSYGTQRPPYRPEYATQGYGYAQPAMREPIPQRGFALDDIRDQTSMDNAYNAYARTTPNVQQKEFTTAAPVSQASAPRPATVQDYVKETVKTPKREPLVPLEDATAVNGDIRELLKLREDDPWKNDITVDAVCTYECREDGKRAASPWDNDVAREKVPVTYATIKEPVQNLADLRARIRDCAILNQDHRISMLKFKQIIPLDIASTEARIFASQLQTEMGPVLNEAKTEFKDMDKAMLTASGIIKMLYTKAELKRTICPLITQMFNAAARSTFVMYTNSKDHEASGLKIDELKDLAELAELTDPKSIGLNLDLDNYQQLLLVCLNASLYAVFKPGKKSFLEVKSDETINLILGRTDTFIYVDGKRITHVDKDTPAPTRAKVVDILNERTYVVVERRAMDTDLQIDGITELANPSASKPLEGGVKYAAVINQLAARVGGVDILRGREAFRVAPSSLGSCSISRRLAS